ncbi:CGNR zinc finger domain-containing protein [Streptomyces sp. NBC_00859]|uniref:CGNR zinc finger domain-containing protein n=1 Tax=Streptomyces sp. NBC_00859 TaxID=2903682 RepID=UPI00386A74A6|nr:ABATE domain-containing protein [Streptomyces sp. NBC_00859]
MGSHAYELRFDSGRICLDLVATGTDSVEQLDCGRRLAAWLTGAGLVPPGTPLPALGADWLHAFTELRSRVAELIRADAEGRPADRALTEVNTRAAGAPPGLRAVRDEGGHLIRELAAPPERDALLAVVARDALELLTDPGARALLRQCEGDNCRRLYLDTSRGRRRRWCSSEVCGNRERVARHRRRAAGAARA